MGSNGERGFPDPALAGRNTGGWKRAESRGVCDQSSQRGQGLSWGSLPVAGDSGHSQPCPCPRGSGPDPGQGKRDGEDSPALRAFPKRVSRPQEDQWTLFVPHQDAPEQLNQLNRSSGSAPRAEGEHHPRSCRAWGAQSSRAERSPAGPGPFCPARGCSRLLVRLTRLCTAPGAVQTPPAPSVPNPGGRDSTDGGAGAGRAVGAVLGPREFGGAARGCQEVPGDAGPCQGTPR